MSARKKKEEPEVIEETDDTVIIDEQTAVEDDAPNYVIPEAKIPPRTPYETAVALRDDIKETLSRAPKRNDATTMPAIVNLRCRTGDFHFLMPQFDALAVKNLWEKYKNDVSPEQFVSYLYTTMGLNPPKLYMYMHVINIS